MPELSVVIPVYGCGDCLATLVARLRSSIEPLTPDFELVLVDDRSRDGAWDTLRRLAHDEPRLRAFRLSRNFGQHAAITAGLARARGRWMVVMDCDLQEPPELIPSLYAKAQEGYDIVRTTRRDRRHSAVRRWGSRLYRELFLESGGDAEYSTLSMISCKVADAFLTLGDRDREYLLMLDWLGFSAATVEFEHADRHAGASSYTLRRLLRVAFDGMFFRTTVLLRLIVAAGFLVAVAGIGLGAFYVYDKLVSDSSPPGYTSLAVLILLLSAVIIVSLGVVGLYVGRIFEQVKNRPMFVVAEEIDPAATSPPAANDAAMGLRPQARSPS
jgi:glycosyltransferase involved in cell wall biosynthesis